MASSGSPRKRTSTGKARRKGGGRKRPLFGRPGVRRALVGGWATVVAVAVGFLLMRAINDRPVPTPPPAIAAAAPTTPPKPAAAETPRVPARPVERPRETAMVAPPPPVTAEEAPFDSRPPWQRFAVPAPAFGKKPVIAIVIDDVGLNKREAEALLTLEAPITLAIMGYADNMADYARRARALGDELMIHVPMEPQGNADPGPRALTVGLSPAEIRARLRWHLDRHDGFIGINNHMGSRFSSDAEGMKVVMEELKARGLAFLDSRTAGSSVGEETARAAGIPTASRDVFLDNEIGASAIEAQLVLTERQARERGMAIAIGHPHEATIEALRRFIPQARARGIVFVPVSAVIARRSGETIPPDATGVSTGGGSGKRSGSPPPPRG